MSRATWHSELDWMTATRNALVAALRADATFLREMGKGTFRTFDDPLVTRDTVEAFQCPLTALHSTSVTLGRIAGQTAQDDETFKAGVILATADDRLASAERLLLAFRQAIVNAWDSLAPIRDNTLASITLGLATFSRVPAKDAARAIWVVDLSLAVWFPAPTD